MRNFHVRIERLLQAAKGLRLDFSRLPYLIDKPGFEQHNETALTQARERYMAPKMYLFDPDEEGTEP